MLECRSDYAQPCLVHFFPSRCLLNLPVAGGHQSPCNCITASPISVCLTEEPKRRVGFKYKKILSECIASGSSSLEKSPTRQFFDLDRFHPEEIVAPSDAHPVSWFLDPLPLSATQSHGVGMCSKTNQNGPPRKKVSGKNMEKSSFEERIRIRKVRSLWHGVRRQLHVTSESQVQQGTRNWDYVVFSVV